MKMLTFAGRNAKEILRDPLNLGFGVGFPVILLLLLSAIQANIPVSMFEIEQLTPGISVFGLSFLTLFAALLIAKDRQSALLARLYTSPLTPVDFIVGYTLPLLPIALAQTLVCYLVGMLLGLSWAISLPAAMLMNLLAAVFFVALGVLCGSVLNDKQAGGICGALLTNLSAWLSGIWFDVKLVGGWFEGIANALPFTHAVKLVQGITAGEGADTTHLLVVAGYALITLIAAVLLFLRQMKRG